MGKVSTWHSLMECLGKSVYLAQFTVVFSLGTVLHKRLSEHAKIDKSLAVKNTNEYFIVHLLL